MYRFVFVLSYVVFLTACSVHSKNGGNDPVGGDTGGGGRIASVFLGLDQNGDMGGGLVNNGNLNLAAKA